MERDWQPIETAPIGEWVLVHWTQEAIDADPNWSWPANSGVPRYALAYCDSDGYWWEPDWNDPEQVVDIVMPQLWRRFPAPPASDTPVIERAIRIMTGEETISSEELGEFEQELRAAAHRQANPDNGSSQKDSDHD